MDPIEIMKRPAPYASGHENAPAAAQLRAKRLCWEYNRTAPDEAERRGEILRELLGTCDPLTFIEPDFRCDYGFNIHTHGLTIVNYNCVMLDTSPIDIGAGRVHRAGRLSGLFGALGRRGAAHRGHRHLRPHHARTRRLDRRERHRLRRRDDRCGVGHRRGERRHAQRTIFSRDAERDEEGGEYPLLYMRK